MKVAPDWAVKAAGMKNRGETQLFKSDARIDSIKRTLAAAGLTDYKLRRADKPDVWLVCKGDWPHTRFGKRSASPAQLANLNKGGTK